ncbi:MAG: choice-of-anchor D domain-containing protein, partial [Terracidiphilus sp.]
LTFHAQQAGVASTPLTLTVSNTGGAPMANVGFQITGQAAGSFSTGSTTCGATLNSGSSCTVQVIFTPASTGGNLATLTVTSATLGVKAAQVALSGTGTATAGINVNPAQMTLAEATVGQASAAQTATITNTSSLNAAGLTLTVTAPFSLTQNTCGTTLAAGASCSAGVVFTPTANGTVAGTLTIGSSTLNSATLVLTGTGGLAGAVGLQPALLNFSTTGVGVASSTQTVTLTNSSAVTLTDLALSVSSGFQLAGNTCSTTLAPGASCTAGVVFAPTSAGQQTGNLTVASTALGASVEAPLAGMGFDFTNTLTGQASQSVASGQTADYTLALTPLEGSTGTFTFQCGSLPANTVCVFNPASESVAANTTGNVTVEVETGHSLTVAQAGRLLRWGAIPIACGLLLLPLGWRRRWRALLLAMVLAILAGGVSSCSGAGGGSLGTGGSGGAGNTNTPAGTYSIPVTATANGVSHKVTLSLTVD